jgi:hypothetical protein
MSNLRVAAFVAIALASSSAFATDADRQPTVTGVFTGRYVDGAPVYRLPSVSVSVNRKAELAKIEREEKDASARARLALNQPRK